MHGRLDLTGTVGVIVVATVAACTSPYIEPASLDVRVLLPLGGLGDRAYADTVYEGVLRARLDIPFSKTEASPASVEEAQVVYQQWMSEPEPRLSTQFLLVVGPTYTDMVRDGDCPQGDRFVVHLDSLLPVCPRRMAVTYHPYGPAFLGGVAAMAVSPRKTAAIVGGMPLPAVEEFVRGFSDGVLFAGGKVLAVEYLSSTPAGFAMPELADVLAEKLFETADVIFPPAGGSAMGVFDAAKRAANRYVLGHDIDQTWMGRGIVIGSVVKRLGQTVHMALEQVVTGAFQEGNLALGMAENGVGFEANPLFEERTVARVKQAMQAAEAAAKHDREQYPW